MSFALKAHNTEGIIRPRLVARSLQMAKLLDIQKKQMFQNETGADTVPYANYASLAGAMMYFMLARVEHCTTSGACDPSKSALFHWLDDTFRRVESLHMNAKEQLDALAQERGHIVTFLQQEKPSFSVLMAVLQTISPYDFTFFSVPYDNRLINEHLTSANKEVFLQQIHHVLNQYMTDGLTILKQFAARMQIVDMRLFLRSVTTLRAFVRGFGKAAMVDHDYVSAADSFAFSGDLTQSPLKGELLHFVEIDQNDHPETCDRILASIHRATTDWFEQFKQIYQEVSSSKDVLVNS